MEQADGLNAWLGKPPELNSSKESSNNATDDAKSNPSPYSISPSPSRSASNDSSNVVEIPHRPASHAIEVSEDEEEDITATTVPHDEELECMNGNEEDMDVDGETVISRQENLIITVPEMSEDEKEEYDFLPGHFTAKRILFAMGSVPDRKFIVKLASGEIDLVSRLSLHIFHVLTPKPRWEGLNLPHNFAMAS